jgi:hypothetical protein
MAVAKIQPYDFHYCNMQTHSYAPDGCDAALSDTLTLVLSFLRNTARLGPAIDATAHASYAIIHRL